MSTKQSLLTCHTFSKLLFCRQFCRQSACRRQHYWIIIISQPYFQTNCWSIFKSAYILLITSYYWLLTFDPLCRFLHSSSQTSALVSSQSSEDTPSLYTRQVSEFPSQLAAELNNLSLYVGRMGDLPASALHQYATSQARQVLSYTNIAWLWVHKGDIVGEDRYWVIQILHGSECTRAIL